MIHPSFALWGSQRPSILGSSFSQKWCCLVRGLWSAEERYTGSNSYYYLFVGRLRFDWSGIKNKKSRLLTYLCFWALFSVSGQNSSIYQTKDLSTLSNSNCKLSEFQKEVWNHLKRYRLDTIAYIVDLCDNTKVLSVITHHSRCTGDKAKAITSNKKTKNEYDTWECKHDKKSKTDLLGSQLY